MPIMSVFPGCACEEACGHAEVHACANRVPARWCSCDPLRRAEAERDRYRAEAIRLQCCYNKAVEPGKCAWLNGDMDEDCEQAGFPCRAVIEEVDGE